MLVVIKTTFDSVLTRWGLSRFTHEPQRRRQTSSAACSNVPGSYTNETLAPTFKTSSLSSLTSSILKATLEYNQQCLLHLINGKAGVMEVCSQFIQFFDVNEAVRMVSSVIPFLGECEQHGEWYTTYIHTDTVPLILSDIVQ
jgi:hypothetical protein